MRRVLLALAVWGLLAGLVAAQPARAAGETLNLDPTSGYIGDNVMATGGGWLPGPAVQLRWDSAQGPLLAQATPNANGFIETSFKVPNTSAGSHTVVACRSDPNKCYPPQHKSFAEVSKPFTVIAPPTTSTSSTAPPTTTTTSSTTTVAPTTSTAPSSTTTSVVTGGTPVFEGVELERPRIPDFLGRRVYELPPLRCQSSTATVIDFEDGASGRDATNAYRDRVTFAPTGAVKYFRPVHGSVSEPYGLVNTEITEFLSSSDMLMSFVRPQSLVGMYIGTDEETTEPITVDLIAFDAAGTQIAQTTRNIGTGPSSVTRCITVEQSDLDAPAAISGVALRFSHGIKEVVDRLFYEQRVRPLPAAPQPLEVHITRPYTQPRPLEIVDVGGYITSASPVTYVSVRNEYGPGTPEYAEHGAGFGWDLGSPPAIPDPSNPRRWHVILPRVQILHGDVISIRARNSGGQFGAASVPVRGEGAPPEPVFGRDGRFDLSIEGFEITQGLSRATSAVDVSSVTMRDVNVANRETIVRAYPRLRSADGSSPIVNGLSATLIAVGPGGAVLPGSPLLPENPTVTASTANTLSTMRATPRQSWNFRLPSAWTTQESIELILRVNPTSGSHWRAECVGCGLGNNELRIRGVQFRPGPVFRLNSYFVHHTTENREGEEVTFRGPSFGQFLDAWATMRRLMPVPRHGLRLGGGTRVTWEGPLDVTTDAGDEVWVFSDTMIPRYLNPRGFTEWDGRYRNTFNAFLFDAAQGCGGKAWLSFPFFQAGTCGFTVTHEATHNLAIEHASNAHGEDDGGGYDRSYPGACGQLSGSGREITDEWFGADVTVTPIAVVPPRGGSGDETRGCSAPHTHDYMSYGGPEWSSPFNWNLTHDRMGTEGVLGASNERRARFVQDARPDAAVLVAGSVLASGGVRFLPPALSSSAVLAAQEGAGATHRLVGRDASGEVIVEAPVSLATPEQGNIARGFGVAVAANDSVVAYALLDEADDELGRLEASDAAPTVVLSGEAQTEWSTEADLEVSWEAADADGDDLTALVEASTDGGATWQTVVAGTSRSAATVPADALLAEGGQDVLVRVQVTDGFHVVASDPIATELGERDAAVMIVSPVDGSIVSAGHRITLEGGAIHATGEPVEDSLLRWVVDGEADGGGGVWDTWGLPAGEHTIALEVLDAGGNVVASEQVTVTVAPDADGDGLPDEWEDRYGFDPADPADPSGDGDEDGLFASDELRWETDPTEVDSDGDDYADGIEVDGGSDPTDPDSIPVEIHGLDIIPTVSSRDESGGSQLPIVGGAVVAALVAGFILWRVRRRPEPASSSD